MEIGRNLVEPTVADVLRAALDAADAAGSELYVVNPDPGTVAELIEVLDDADGPAVRLLAPGETLDEATREFTLAARAADHVAADRLAVRVGAAGANRLLATADSVVAVVPAGDRVAGLTTDDRPFIDRAYDRFREEWDASDPYALRTPALSRVHETLRAALGAETAADFDAMVSVAEEVRRGAGLDEVTIALLSAARNERLLYDVSKWGEDVGVASKATFSRTKTDLEERGLIGTEKVPIDVGRPRLRLLVADDRLRGTDIEEFAAVAADMLAGD